MRKSKINKKIDAQNQSLFHSYCDEKELLLLLLLPKLYSMMKLDYHYIDDRCWEISNKIITLFESSLEKVTPMGWGYQGAIARGVTFSVCCVKMWLSPRIDFLPSSAKFQARFPKKMDYLKLTTVLGLYARPKYLWHAHVC